MHSQNILSTSGVTKRFGGVTAVNNVDFTLKRGEVVGILGPNGAGKRSFFNLLAGAIQPDSGTINLFDEDVTSSQSHEMCAKGLARTFQLVRPLKDLTVLENVMVGAFSKTRSVREAKEIALSAILLVGLEGLENVISSNLTLGFRKRLEVARALATKPELLLLDEVMSGLNPAELDSFLEMLRSVNQDGVTLVVVEHIVPAVIQISTRIVVMVQGSTIAEGSPSEVMNNQLVIDAYLGELDYDVS
jgi:branched-chain amino acid transport system ATP-binding protein